VGFKIQPRPGAKNKKRQTPQTFLHFIMCKRRFVPSAPLLACGKPAQTILPLVRISVCMFKEEEFVFPFVVQAAATSARVPRTGIVVPLRRKRTLYTSVRRGGRLFVLLPNPAEPRCSRLFLPMNPDHEEGR